jgi:hypothetical protein
MFRVAPDHALYQGDVIVVPMVQLRDPDPVVITDVTEAELRVCRRCGANYEDPFPNSKGRQCPACQAFEKITKQKRQTLLSSRLKAGENLFRGRAERVVASVEVVAAMVLSHSCDIDNADFVRMAPLRSLVRFKEAQLDDIRHGIGNLAYFYLAEGDAHHEAIVELDRQFNVPVTFLGQSRTFESKVRGRSEHALVPFVEAVSSRILSLDAIGLRLLYERMTGHLVRPRTTMMKANPSDEALVDDPDRPQKGDLPSLGWWWPFDGWMRKAQQLKFKAADPPPK